MKKIYTSTLALTFFVSGLFAQGTSAQKESMPLLPNQQGNESTTSIKESKNLDKDLQVDLWTDEFDDASTWNLEHDSTICDFDWEIGVGLENQGSYGSGPLESTTASNGLAMLDSEYWYFENLDPNESVWMTNATAIDLTGEANVILEFESFYRDFNSVTPYVVISTNNTDWPALTFDYDAETNANVFEVHQDVAGNTNSTNPTLIQLNISDIAGGESQVWVRFHWVGEFNNGAVGYTWFVDDARIFQLPDNDLKMHYSVISHSNTGDEYGRVPESQLNPIMYLSALSSNIGGVDQTDVVTDIVIVDENMVEVVNLSSTPEGLAVGDSVDYQPEDNYAYTEGLYTANFVVTSAEEMDGDEFGNNTSERYFEITNDLYSLDGIDVRPSSTLSSLGTNSFTDASDGFMLLVSYEINEDESAVHGIEFLLSSTSEPGGSVLVHLMDTTDVLADAVDNPIVSSDEVVITQEHIDAGVVRVYFDDPEMLDANAYYAVVEMFSEDNEYDFRILDDLTVPQPGNSSMIYIPGDQVYGNGNAMAIRLLTAAANSIDEIENIAVLAQNHPNPAKEFTTISFDLLDNQEVTVRLTDMLGKVVVENNLGNLNPGTHNHTFDLNGLKAGTYHYSIVTENGSLSKSMQIIK